MLPSNRRISKTTFKSFGRGLNYHSTILSLSVYSKKDSTASQFSFICSKKVAKMAVKRNLLRRRGYNAVGEMLTKIKPGFYFVFNFKKGADMTSYADIKNEINSLLQKSAGISV